MCLSCVSSEVGIASLSVSTSEGDNACMLLSKIGVASVHVSSQYRQLQCASVLLWLLYEMVPMEEVWLQWLITVCLLLMSVSIKITRPVCLSHLLKEAWPFQS